MTRVEAWVVGPSTRIDEACLSPVERAEAGRLGTAAGRARHRRSRAVLRHALAEVLGTDPAEVPLVAPAGARPIVDVDRPGAGPAVSLAHAAGHVAVAICPRGPVGIDVEVPAVRRRPVPRAVLTADRLAAVAGLVAEPLGPTAVWVTLEAALKAAGTGFAFPLADVTLCRTGTGVRVEVGTALHCTVALRVLPGGVVAAVAGPTGTDVVWHPVLARADADRRPTGAPTVAGLSG